MLHSNAKIIENFYVRKLPSVGMSSPVTVADIFRLCSVLIFLLGPDGALSLM